MTVEPEQPEDYSDEPDLPPDTIVELESLEAELPVSLEEGNSDPDSWGDPPEGWSIGAHEDEYRVDPDVAIGEDNQKDWPPAPLISSETQI